MNNKCCACWEPIEQGKFEVKNKKKQYMQGYCVWVRSPECKCECHIPEDVPSIEVNIKSYDSPRMVKKKVKKALEQNKECPSE